jgi:hypothetical protein
MPDVLLAGKWSVPCHVNTAKCPREGRDDNLRGENKLWAILFTCCPLSPRGKLDTTDMYRPASCPIFRSTRVIGQSHDFSLSHSKLSSTENPQKEASSDVAAGSWKLGDRAAPGGMTRFEFPF